MFHRLATQQAWPDQMPAVHKIFRHTPRAAVPVHDAFPADAGVVVHVLKETAQLQDFWMIQPDGSDGIMSDPTIDQLWNGAADTAEGDLTRAQDAQDTEHTAAPRLSPRA